jgi:histone H3/H4
MPIYHVSLDLSLPSGLDEHALDRLMRRAIRTAACKPLEVTPTSLLVDADPLAIETLQAALREALEGLGGHLNTFARTPR